nr:hypothetical protein [uncultured Oscillibacter sp.]
MTIEEQLKQEILSRYKSVRSFTTAIDIPYSTLDSAFKRGIMNAGVSTMVKVFSALDLDIESVREATLRRKTGAEETAFPLSKGEKSLIDLYRELNQEGQEKLVGYAKDLTRTGDYKKVGSYRMVSKEA